MYQEVTAENEELRKRLSSAAAEDNVKHRRPQSLELRQKSDNSGVQFKSTSQKDSQYSAVRLIEQQWDQLETDPISGLIY